MYHVRTMQEHYTAAKTCCDYVDQHEDEDGNFPDIRMRGILSLIRGTLAPIIVYQEKNGAWSVALDERWIDDTLELEDCFVLSFNHATQAGAYGWLHENRLTRNYITRLPLNVNHRKPIQNARPHHGKCLIYR